MKKFVLLTGTWCLVAMTVMAQIPQTFSYQAVARDANGDPIADQELTIRIGILQNETLIWQEDHPVTTSELGLFSLSIGDPAALNAGGSVASFSDIPWGEGEFLLQVSVDSGNGFTDLGTSYFESVPFALYAARSATGTGEPGTDSQVLSLTGNTLSISGGNSVDLTSILPQDMDNQEISLDSVTLSISGGNSVDLGSLVTENTDNQQLELTGNNLAISGGNSVDLSQTGGGGNWDGEGDTISTYKYVGIGTSNPNLSTLAVQGLNVLPEAPLFEVRREDGFPVFAVYNDGVMVYVDEEAKGIKGGFAVGGYNRSSKGLTQQYLTVSPDSVRVYVPETTQAKGIKGGFAVGGYNRTAKGPGQEFLYVTADSTRVYVPESSQAKGIKGGFAVGGYNRTSKGTGQEYLTVTPDSTRVYVPNKGNDPNYVGLQGGFAVNGYNEGAKGATDYLMGINRGITRFNTTDIDKGFAIGSQGDGWGSNYLELTPTNSFIGSGAGHNNMAVDTADEWGFGTMNVFLGYQAGMWNNTGHHNTFLGYKTGTSNVGGDPDYPELGSENIFIGSQAGFSNTTGFNNVFIGFNAGINTDEGERNIFIGSGAGYSSEGLYNTFIGCNTGAFSGLGEGNVGLGDHAGYSSGGDNNVMIGTDAGYGNNSDFYENTLVGYRSGRSLTTGSNNVILGTGAGLNTTDGSGNVFIGANAGANESGDSYLYIDNTDTDYPLIYGIFDGFYVELNGDVTVYGSLYEASDAKLKTNIQPVTGSLDKLRQINGVSFQWKDREERKGVQNQTSLGLIAQEVETVLPELVNEDRRGIKSVNYDGMIPVLLEAIKEQQKQIEALEMRIAELEK